MTTLEISKKKMKSTFALAFASLPMKDDAVEYDEIEFNSSVEEEPPAWHEAILKKREEEWKNRKILSKSVEQVFRELRAEAAMKK